MDSLLKIHALGKAQWMALLDGCLSPVSPVDMLRPQRSLR